MNITDHVNSCYEPFAALICYKDASPLNSRSSCDSKVELHPIDRDGNLRSARPVSRRFLAGLVRSFGDEIREAVPHGPVPENLLYADTREASYRLVWYTPPAVRHLSFTRNIGLPDGEYHMPGTVYATNGRSLRCYAFAGETAAAGTPLLLGPFFNTTRGSVCLGSAQAPKPEDPTWEKALRYWETLFWNSANSHLGGAQNPTRRNLVLTLQDYRDRPFDTDECQEAGIYVRDLFKPSL